MRELIEKYLPEAIKIRQHLHQIPELKYQEFETSAFIHKLLLSYGYESLQKVTKTGIVALLKTGTPGPTIALRADIDALPILEETGSSYESKHVGVMHACGHDGHTATLLFVARLLQIMKDRLSGTVKLIFQPAEEGGQDSSAMIQEGVLEGVDAIFGYHNWPGLPLGTIATRPGCILAGSGRFEIKLKGKRAHLAKPQDAVNPIMIGASLIERIKEISIRGTILNLVGFNTGDWQQGTPERGELVGCYFYESETALLNVQKRIEALVEGVGTVEFYPFQSSTVNSKKETSRLCSLEEVIDLDSPQMAAEDFGEYLKHVPGCYFFVGTGEQTPPLHTPAYDFPDEILPIAAHAFLSLVLFS